MQKQKSSILRRLEMLDTASRKKRIKGSMLNGAEATINITPLVDVVLVLLIIFMVVTPMLNDGIDLPEAKSPQKLNSKVEDLKISIAQNGEIHVGDVLVREDDLEGRITMELSSNHFRPVYLSADKDLAYRKVRRILKALREVGVSDAGLVSTEFSEEAVSGS